jgi:PAB-dependent poly(A)-specific ribonuclease subunit 2
MNFTSKGTREILIAGCQDEMFRVDVEKGTIIDTVSVVDNYAKHADEA